MKDYVFTEFPPFGGEKIILISRNKKKGEKELRKEFPHMKAIDRDSYVLDPQIDLLGRVQEMDVVE